MTPSLLDIQHISKNIQNGTEETVTIMNDLSLSVKTGDFITILGGNGAGKSTLFNCIAGTMKVNSGSIILNNHTITNWSEEKRASLIARVFQDPKMGTAPRMTVSENLLLAQNRGKKRTLKLRELKENRENFKELCSLIGNGLENHLDTPTGNLSGGQRQALSLLMATMSQPDLLLLDEHTAALDPKTSRQLMALTNEQIIEKKLTCLMITHRMEDALNYGNRLLLLEKGQIKMDLDAEQKSKLKLQDLFLLFEEEENAD